MILCLGTTPVMQRTMVFERVHLDAVNRAAEVRETASGKSINVARVLHLLGEEVVATGFLGGDPGRFIRDDLRTAGVCHDFVTVGPKTRTCVTVIDRGDRDRGGGTVTELVEESKEVEKPAWGKLRGRVAEHLPRAKVMVLSGSLTPGAPQDFYGYCVKRATEYAVNTIVDASGEPLRRALPARPLVVKPNRSELARTLDAPIESDAALRDAIRQLVALGPHWVVVTQGKDGAVVSDGDRFWRVRPPRVAAVNPIGSGDALAAGLASAISRGQRLPEACRLGVACGAANAMTLTPADVRPDDVAELLQRVESEDW
jgi:tagatose 6-phosphate kinase